METQQLTIYDIGYQMRTIEQFIDELKRNKITTLIDLREKPYSRKPGYSKNQIRANIEGAGIEYRWLGNILGGRTCRSTCNERANWDIGCRMVADYARIRTVCIMCLENDVNECHRKELIEILTRDYDLESVNL